MRRSVAVGRRSAPHRVSSGRARQAASRLAAYQSGGLLVALIALGGFFTAYSANFLTRSNLLVVLLQVSIVGLVAIPGSMLVLSGYVDLSVGSVAVLAVAIFGQMVKVNHLGVAAAIVIALAAGAGWGLMNGVAHLVPRLLADHRHARRLRRRPRRRRGDHARRDAVRVRRCVRGSSATARSSASRCRRSSSSARS